VDFDRETGLEPAGPDRWRGELDRRWWIVFGPNGGYVAAILLRALALATADPERAPRSLTAHFLRSPREGPFEMEVRKEREGGNLTALSARMHQDGRLVALALGALSKPREAPEFQDLRPPDLPPPEEVEPLDPERGRGSAPMVPAAERWDFRPVRGARPFTGADRGEAGAWLRLPEGHSLDPFVVCAMSDALYPAVWTRLERMTAVPTVDLSVHFRATLPPPGDDGWCLALFRSTTAADGFVEEDGELWSRDGTLLAQSRQLALMIEPPG
jgi:acyl-CoA thioesterase